MKHAEPKGILSKCCAVSSTPQTLYEIAGAKHITLGRSTCGHERPRTLIIACEGSRPLNSFRISGIGPFVHTLPPILMSSNFGVAAQFSMLDPVHFLLSRGSLSYHDVCLLKEEVGDEEAQQAEQRDDLHRDAASAGRLCSEAILGGALLSAACHVPLAQTRGCLLL